MVKTTALVFSMRLLCFSLPCVSRASPVLSSLCKWSVSVQEAWWLVVSPLTWTTCAPVINHWISPAAFKLQSITHPAPDYGFGLCDSEQLSHLEMCFQRKTYFTLCLCQWSLPACLQSTLSSVSQGCKLPKCSRKGSAKRGQIGSASLPNPVFSVH